MNQRRVHETSTALLWIDEARDHLKIAGKHDPGLNLRLLCAEAHMGAEKAIKGVMIAHGEAFSYTHDIGLLLDEAASIGEIIPDEVRKGETLTLYSGAGKYPHTADERATTTREEYDEAMDVAAAVVGWTVRRVEILVAKALEEGEEGTDRRDPSG